MLPLPPVIPGGLLRDYVPDVGEKRPPDQGPGHDLHPVPLLQLHGGRGHLPAAAVLRAPGAGSDVADSAGPVSRPALALPRPRPRSGSFSSSRTGDNYRIFSLSLHRKLS